MSFTRRPRRATHSRAGRPGPGCGRRLGRLPAAPAGDAAGRLTRLSSIIAALDQGIAFVDPHGAVVEINDRYLALLGLSRDQVLGRGLAVLDLETEDYQAGAFLDLFRRGAAHAPVSFDRRLGDRDVTAKLQPVLENGLFTGLIVSLIDVTPLVEARLSVEREKSFLEQVITIAGAAICIVNRDDVVVTINDEFTTITGYNRDQALGRRRGELLRESPPSPCPALPGDASVQKRQSQILTRDGRKVTILKNAAPIRDSQGRATGGIESFVDVSDLIRARVEAEEASRMKSAFLANMSHEIRTPLNAIMGLSQLLLKANPTPQQRECLETMRSAGEGLLVVLNDVLDFSRIEVGRMQVRPVPVDLDRLLEEMRRIMAPAADARGLILAIARDPALPRVAVCDPVRLKQILLNLLSNAIKFTAQGRIDLAAELAPASQAPPVGDTATPVLFRVRDTGPGIPEALRERIFEPFVQADDAVARNHGGTGLGLSISDRLVRLLGGSGLAVASAPDKGSEFSFVLPLTLPLAKAAPPPPDHPLPPAVDLGGLRALVAEDNPFNRFLLQKILEKLGVGRQAFAEDGNKALNMILAAAEAGEPYHIVFMDLRMPDLDGLEVTRRVRRAGVATPIVALTAQAAPDDAARCREAGMSGFFSKPYRINDLEAVLVALAGEGGSPTGP